MRRIAYSSMALSILSKWVITTIKGKWKMLASSKVSGLIGALLTPETTHSAYSGKKEQRLDTTCF